MTDFRMWRQVIVLKTLRLRQGETDGDFEGAVFQDTDVAKWLEAVAYSLAARAG